jgi:RNA polymerase sigma factor (sigma-70 family)
MKTQPHLTTYTELDEALDRLAQDPESFATRARVLAEEWNADGIDLDLPSPQGWRRPIPAIRPGSVASIEEQLRAEIDSILPMGREEEAALARRIEFARIRLELALEAEGLEGNVLKGSVSYDPTDPTGRALGTCQLPPKVCRRWTEFHAMRLELVERNLYLVLINVERYAHLGVPRLDLVQEGSAALFRAVDGFDWRRGLLFRTYAVHWLNQAFRSYLYNFGQTVRVPVYLQKAMKHVKSAIERLGDPNADPGTIATEAGLGVHLVESALAASRSTFSMDAPLAWDSDGNGLGDLIGDAGSGEMYSVEMEEFSLEDGLKDALDRLTDRERFVIEMRFGIDREREHTLSEVAAELGVSLERVRQIQVRAIHKMKTPSLRKAIDPYL